MLRSVDLGGEMHGCGGEDHRALRAVQGGEAEVPQAVRDVTNGDVLEQPAGECR